MLRSSFFGLEGAQYNLRYAAGNDTLARPIKHDITSVIAARRWSGKLVVPVRLSNKELPSRRPSSARYPSWVATTSDVISRRRPASATRARRGHRPRRPRPHRGQSIRP